MDLFFNDVSTYLHIDDIIDNLCDNVLNNDIPMMSLESPVASPLIFLPTHLLQ